MFILTFFGVVLGVALALNVIDKIRSYNNPEDRSVWQEGDSVMVRPKNSKGVGGFGFRIDNHLEQSAKEQIQKKVTNIK